ncbi:MAG: diphthine--ammonia ligase [Nanoarchaeota archaeon]|nr:diphthine--ammonia ligase [Nanoarchaeota archaeon]
MKLGVLFSGGKDSVFAAWMAVQKGYELGCLISVISENPDSYMYHPVNINVINKQAEVMDVPLLVKKSKGKKELELIDLKRAIDEAKKKYDIEGVCVGAISSNYQFERVKKICRELSVGVFSPMWGWSEGEYMHQMIKNKFKVVVVKVAADGLDENWLGKVIDEKAVEELGRKRIHIAGEGGEYESVVLECPLFKRGLKIMKDEKKMDSEFSGNLIIKKIGLTGKG